MKKVIIKCLILIFLATILFNNNPALADTNNLTSNQSTTYSLPLNSVASGTLTNINNLITYVFTISNPGAYSINVSLIPQSGYSLQYTVTNSTGNVFLYANSVSQTQMFYADSFNLIIGGQGQYKVSVFHAPNDGVLLATALQLKLNTPTIETIPSWSSYTNFYYNITLPSYTTYSFTQNYLGNSNSYLDVEIVGWGPNFQTNILLFNNYTQHTISELLNAGNYTIRLIKMKPYSGSFNLTVNLIPSYPPYNLYLAPQISLDTPITTDISTNNVFNLTTTFSSFYTFNLTSSSVNTFWLYIFNQSGTILGNVTTYTYPEQITIDLTAGVYYILVDQISGSGQFTVEASSSSPPPTTSTTPSTSSPGSSSTSSRSSSTQNSSSSSSHTTSTSILTASNGNGQNSSSNTKNSKPSPFSSIYVIFMSLLIISSITLISRRRK